MEKPQEYDINTKHRMSKGKIEITCEPEDFEFWEYIISKIHKYIQQYKRNEILLQQYKELMKEEIDISCNFLEKIKEMI